MKKILLSLLILALLLCGCAESGDSVGDVDDTVEQTEKTVYIRTSHTLTSGDSVTRTDYILDENDRVSQVVIYTNEKETMRYEVECDEHGNYVRWVGGGIIGTFQYDEAGHLLGKSLYTGEVLISSTEYTWEGDNQLGVAERNGSQEQRTVWFYNENGQKVREELYQNGVLLNYSQITNGEDGRPVSQDVYNADGTQHSTVTYTYDAASCTATTTLSDGTVEQRTTYLYDEFGNLLSTTVYDGEGQMLSQIVDTWKAVTVPVDSLRASI